MPPIVFFKKIPITTGTKPPLELDKPPNA